MKVILVKQQILRSSHISWRWRPMKCQKTTDLAFEAANPWQFGLAPHQRVLADHLSSCHQHACMKLHSINIMSIQTVCICTEIFTLCQHRNGAIIKAESWQADIQTATSWKTWTTERPNAQKAEITKCRKGNYCISIFSVLCCFMKNNGLYTSYRARHNIVKNIRWHCTIATEVEALVFLRYHCWVLSTATVYNQV